MFSRLAGSVLRRPDPRLAVAVMAVLIVLGGVTVAGCLYINHAAAGVGRVPVMFGDAHYFHAHAQARPRAAQS